MENKRLHRCCFTGHRPQKLSYDENGIKTLLNTAIDKAIKMGYTTFITGMAMGVDIWAAEIVLEKRKTNGDLHLICAIPHPNFENGRNPYEVSRYKNVIENSDYCVVLSNHYYKACYQKRNQFMVDRSNLVIAVYNGNPSGTRNTIEYAKRCGIEVINVI